MPLQATSGAASYDAFGGGVAAVPNYIEECFSTTLYTGNGSTQTITNGIDLAGKGGLVWTKCRNLGRSHVLIDTVRGGDQILESNTTTGNQFIPTAITSFGSSGYTIDFTSNLNANTNTFVSWTFREQPKFFDVVTYTGTGSTQTIAHNLGSVPGCIIVKATNDTRSWAVYHRSLGATKYIYLNSTGIGGTTNGFWDDTEPTSTVFTVRNDGDVNGPGTTYVAYLFAHNAGGFGLTGADNVISCGGYTGNGSSSGPITTLGYEPQWILIKRTDSSSGGSWALFDNMRGLTVAGSQDPVLYPNLSDAEFTGVDILQPLATGFQLTGTNWNASGGTYIYIAIRRGPMKTPTSGTSVFTPVTYTGNGSTSSGQLVTAGFPVDMGINRYNRGGAGDWDIVDRLRGLTSIGVSPNSRYLNPHNTNAEASGGGYIFDATNTSVDNFGFSASFVQLNYLFRRAPGFFDEVCYTGTGSATTVTHNLGVAPELMIVKPRSATGGWQAYSAPTGSGSVLLLNGTGGAVADTTTWNNTAPTASVFSLGTSPLTNNNTTTYVAYLFASATGVSRVGAYTGTGATQVINCGFTAGARFVLIKATSTTGNWLVWDSARGIVSGNDPYLVLNSTAAEVTNTDWVDTAASGFELSNAGGNLANSNGVSYIFLAIA